VFHEAPPEDFDGLLDRYAEALYFLEHQAQRTAFELGKVLMGENG